MLEIWEGDAFWRTKGVKQDEHPNSTFYTHEKSKSTQRQSRNVQK